MTRLDEIQARADAATAGPWDCSPPSGIVYPSTPWGLYSAGANGMAGHRSVTETDDEPGLTKADAEFIAHAREDVPKLVAALRAVEELCTTSEEHAEPYGDTPTIYVEAVRDMIREALGE